MSKVTGQQRQMEQQRDEISLSEQDVSTFLLNNPDFFLRQPALLNKIRIPHGEKGSVSLVELQGEQLRQKVRQLSGKLNQLVGVAKQNEAIYRVYADLNLRLLKAADLTELQLILEEVMLDQLKLSAVALKPFKGAQALPEIQRKLFLEKHFKRQAFFFGRISEHEKQLLLGEQPAESVALVLLGEQQELGILAVGSQDASHFNPDMDTLLLAQLQQFLQVLLGRLLT